MLSLCLILADGRSVERALDGATLSVGSGASANWRISDSSLAEVHAIIHAERWGLWLEVGSAAAPLHLNARPVRERALLRPGDTLSLGRLSLCVRQTPAPQAGNHPSLALAAVRCSAGRQSGLVRDLTDQPLALPFLAVGQAARHCAWLSFAASALTITRGDAPALRVNGNAVDSQRLRNGDLVVLDAELYLIEASAGCALPIATDVEDPRAAIDPALSAAQLFDPAPVSARFSPWGLLLAAALIGFALALALVTR